MQGEARGFFAKKFRIFLRHFYGNSLGNQAKNGQKMPSKSIKFDAVFESFAIEEVFVPGEAARQRRPAGLTRPNIAALCPNFTIAAMKRRVEC